MGSTAHRTYQDTCGCFEQYRPTNRRRVPFHTERQDLTAPGWLRLCELVDEAVADGREEFRPLRQLSPSYRRQIITLPRTIRRLTAVRHLDIYGSNIARIPPEIGSMTALEEFTPYTSHRLHWLPYEITRCESLTRSTVSTRSLYGNPKFRPPFPQLPGPAVTPGHTPDPGTWGADTLRSCSVCDTPLSPAGGVHQAWITLRVGSDDVPLLVNACSTACVEKLPSPARGYVPQPHTGGPALVQPPATD